MANTTIIQQSNINFTVDTRSNRYTGWGRKYTNTDNIGETYPAYPDDINFGINAIEIDWNDAQLGKTIEITPGTNLSKIKTTGDLILLIKKLEERITTLEEGGTPQIKQDPTFTIPLPAITTIADGQSITMTGTSNVPGTLTLSPSAGTGWTTTVTPLNGQTTHKIQITNIAASTSGTATNYESSSIAAGYIKGTFTPNDTTSYNTLSAIAINTGSITISPYVYPTGATIEGSTQITNGSTGTITVNVLPSNATNKVIRLDANSGIVFGTTGNSTYTNASSGQTIVVRGTSTGDSSIIWTVTGTVGSSQLIQAITGTHNITIIDETPSQVPVTGITLNKSTLSVSANGTGTITATIAPSNATNKNVNWTSSDTSIAIVTSSTTSGNAATVTWKAAGSVTITAKAAGDTSKTATCTVTCSPVAVTGITLNKSTLSVSANGTGTITATIAPSNATNKNVNWTSSDTSIATVTSSTTSGNAATVTWKAAGSVTITAKAAGDTSKTATCTVECLGETTYYWYAGQTQPSTMSDNPTVDDTNFTVNKWHTLSSNQLSQTITGGTAGNSWYVAVPTIKGFSAYASDLVTPNTAWNKITTITVKSISYDVWKPASTGAKMNIYMK